MNSTIARKTIAAVGAVLLAAGGLDAAEAAKPAGPITVTFVAPEKFTDARDRYSDKESNRDFILGRLREYLEKRAPERIAPGQKLAVTITDVDLAGDFEPWRGFRFEDIRVLKDVYPPRMTLSFVLTDADGKVVKQGERKLMDTGYLLSHPGFSDDDLRYDKGMLDNWLRTEFTRAKK
jgi:hypothetical protein